MAQFELINDESKNGFYLDFFQVYNWGIFDSNIYTMRCRKKSSLLTGLNGSGKTTLVDAFLSLIVPPRRRFYNQSAGAESKKERDEASYVLGTYGSRRDEEFISSTAKNLRSKDKCFSILLGCFVLGDDQGPVTLMQMRFFSQAGTLQRIYSITRKKLSIKDIQKEVQDLTPHSKWKKIMTEKFNTAFYGDNFSSYSEAFSQLAGLRSDRALYLFSQTVGLKGVGNLNEFIRTHMFEGQNTEAEFEGLVKHYEELSQIYNEIEKAQEQIRLLKEVLEAGKTFELCEKKDLELKEIKNSLQLWYLKTALALIEKRIIDLNQEKLIIENKAALIEEEIKKVDFDLDSVKSAIQKNSTSIRLTSVEHKIDINERELKIRREKIRDYERCAQVLSLETPQTEKKFNENLKLLPELKNELTKKENTLFNSILELNVLNKDTKNEITELTEELESLSKRNTNIPSQNIRIRDEICEGINCSQRELTFAGELLQVLKSESRWEGAIEKLLHHFALCLLVPENLYTKVNTYAAKNNLKGRLVYLKTDKKPQLKNFTPQNNSLISKLEINRKHELSDWIESYVTDNFDYICTDDMEEFNHAAKAITSSGLIKAKIRHEKDDRPQRSGTQSFVLGWDNIQKRRELSFRLDKLKTEIEKNTEKLNKYKIEQDEIKNKLIILENLTKLTLWDEIDVKKYAAALDASHEEKAKLLKDDKELNQLEERLKLLKEDRQLKEAELSALIQEKGKLEQQLADISLKQERMQNQFDKNYLDKDSEEIEILVLNFEKYFKINKSFENLDILDTAKENFSSKLEKEAEKSEQSLKNTERRLREKMSALTNAKDEIKIKFPAWSADVRDLQAEAAALPDFKAFYERLLHDDLPACLKKFKVKFNDSIRKDITDFSTHLDSGRTQIIQGIGELNKSLKTIPYSKNPPTYIKLEHRFTNDIQIKEFQGLLLAAIPDSASIFNKEADYEFEDFKKIKTLISYLKENDQRRKKVLDVRQWFIFAAIEYYQNDNTQKQYYEDSASLSGGEKSKLTYTILASAIAFQFGITSGSPRSLRLVIIDEVFSKVDIDNSCYAMELFKQIGLQMILVTPMDKINIVEDYISSMHITEKKNDNTSRLLEITIERYKQEKEELS
ncbi:ATP-binding protein [Treponema putidum]|uniref:ATP-binding protein n=1 Tax=Treponema putidum TaxID=221027 RepID=UPI003D93F18D